MEVLVGIVVAAFLVAVLSKVGDQEQEQEQCCGTTVPQGCSPCSCTFATTPFTIALSSIVWSVFLYSAGLLHWFLSLIGVQGFYPKSVRFYQRKISSRVPARCNLHPTCSQYSLEMVEEHGIWKGVGLTVNRLRQCAEASRKETVS